MKCNRTSFLKRFRLKQERSNIKYQFTCCNLQNLICNMTSKTTSWDTYAKALPIFLDRHSPDCGESGFLQDFILQRDAAVSKIRYAYTCCDVTDPKWKSSMQCQEKETAYTSEGDLHVINLALQRIMCDDGYALSKFKLYRSPPPHGQWKFKFRCCKFEPQTASGSTVTWGGLVI